jgi:uncharacterized membrane protein
MKKETKENIVFIILLFLTFSFIGWLWELIYEFLKHGVISNHGVLLGPWLPIYGTGSIIVYLLLNRYKKNSFVVFMGSFVFCTIIEYFTGWYLETTKNHKWWSYVNMPFNIDGRICLLSSIFFGIAGLFAIYIGIPKLKIFLKKFDLKKLTIICFLLTTLFILDLIYSSYSPNYAKKYQIIDTKKIGEIKIFKK